LQTIINVAFHFHCLCLLCLGFYIFKAWEKKIEILFWVGEAEGLPTGFGQHRVE
jgi:hypothetical protein